MNTGNMSNDEANAIGNFIEQYKVKSMELKEYLHLYMPFYALVPDEQGACLVVAINDQSVFIDSGCDYPFEEIKPILRTLEDLADCEKELLWHETGQEIIKFDILNMSYKVVHNPRATLMLLRFGIDIFGLIENGLAIRQKHIPIEFEGFPIENLVSMTPIAKEYINLHKKI